MKLSKRDREILAKTVLIPPPRRGKIDPREIRRAVKAVIDRHLKAEAEAAANAKAKGNGGAHPPEAE